MDLIIRCIQCGLDDDEKLSFYFNDFYSNIISFLLQLLTQNKVKLDGEKLSLLFF